MALHVMDEANRCLQCKVPQCQKGCPDYRGEIIVALHNHSDAAVTIEPGDRVAQIVLAPYITAAFNEVEELSDTVRGEGGFGSTGTK